MGRAKGRRLLLSERREMADTQDTGFYNVHDGVKGRDGGPYLDFVERQQAELNRAKGEGREPETEDGKLPATAGTPFVTAAELVDNSKMSNPSRALAPGLETAIDDSTFGDADYLADPVETLAVSTGTEAPDDAFDPTKNDGPSGSPSNADTADNKSGDQTPAPAATKSTSAAALKSTSQ